MLYGDVIHKTNQGILRRILVTVFEQFRGTVVFCSGDIYAESPKLLLEFRRVVVFYPQS